MGAVERRHQTLSCAVAGQHALAARVVRADPRAGSNSVARPGDARARDTNGYASHMMRVSGVACRPVETDKRYRCRLSPYRETIMRLSIFMLAATAALSVVSIGTASAETQWDAHHPRRAEVNHRLQNQDHRINTAVRDGKMSPAEAAKLHRDDHQIRQEERDMAHQDNGHITRQEDRTLNQQENQVSRQIGQ
jgi:hypothetical protein